MMNRSSSMDTHTQALDYAHKFPQAQIVSADIEEDVLCVKDGAMRRMSLIPNIVEVTDGAKEGTEQECHMTILQGILVRIAFHLSITQIKNRYQIIS